MTFATKASDKSPCCHLLYTTQERIGNRAYYTRNRRLISPSPQKITAVIFDIDGLMFDTERIAFEHWGDVVRDFGYSADLAFMQSIAGLSEHDIAVRLKEKFGDDFPLEAVRNDRTRRADELFHREGMFPKAGLFELLDMLDERKVPRAVATSSYRERAMMKLSLGGVQERFPIIVCGDDVSRAKPFPDIFLRAAELLGCSPSACLVLEDSENGVRAAHAAGTRVALVPDLKDPDEKLIPLVEIVLPSLVEVRAYIEHRL